MDKTIRVVRVLVYEGTEEALENQFRHGTMPLVGTNPWPVGQVRIYSDLDQTGLGIIQNMITKAEHELALEMSKNLLPQMELPFETTENRGDPRPSGEGLT